jgi:hypothetical protein
LGIVGSLRFLDHDLTDPNNFPKLAPENYLCTASIPDSLIITIEIQEWATGLQITRILNLLEILHFGRSVEINICVKLFLSCVHEGFLWLDREVSIDTHLIAWIIGFPLVGEEPIPLFTDKTQKKYLAKRMKEKYGTFRGAHILECNVPFQMSSLGD